MPPATIASPEYSPRAVAAAGLVALAVAMGIGRFAFTPLLPMMQEDTGLSVAAGGWLASANYLGYLLGALSAASLKQRPATIIRAGLVLIAVTTFAMGLEDSFAVWALWRTAAGVASAWVLVHVSAWSLDQLARRNRPLLSGVVFAGVGSGIGFAGVACLLLMQAHVDAPTAWMAFGAAALLAALAAWRVYGTNPTAARPAAAERSDGASPWRGDGLRLVLCYGAFGFGYIIPATFLPAMAKQIVSDPWIFGWSWPVFGAAAALSTLAATRLQRAWDNRSLWIATHFVMATGVALPVFHDGIVAVLAAAVLVGGTFMVTTMIGLQEGRRAGGANATRLIGAMTAAFAAGQILGPIAAALAVQATGTLAAALLVAAAALAAGGCGLLPGRRKLRRHESSTTEETC